jgi:hypothetical protein
MSRPDETIAEARPARQACLMAGCPCKDARIVSQRRAAYFAALAKANGETADRVVGTQPGWRLPTSWAGEQG